MPEQIKCPHCGGTKIANSSETTYRCLYCGSTFLLESAETQKSPAPQQQPQVIIIQQNNQSNQEQERIKQEKIEKEKDEKLKRYIGAFLFFGGLVLITAIISIANDDDSKSIASFITSLLLFAIAWILSCFRKKRNNQ
ncbi:MAG: hypothetical protein K2M94_06780 [Paramuribaculum sp.]|nr:hypothetical protein [Paramuribaculum sp.]